jgi:hypothetical protein
VSELRNGGEDNQGVICMDYNEDLKLLCYGGEEGVIYLWKN